MMLGKVLRDISLSYDCSVQAQHSALEPPRSGDFDTLFGFPYNHVTVIVRTFKKRLSGLIGH